MSCAEALQLIEILEDDEIEHLPVSHSNIAAVIRNLCAQIQSTNTTRPDAASSDTKPNMVNVGSGLYIVRTQAGFRRSLKHFCGEVPSRLEGYPTSYPSMVHLSDGYAGYVYIRANCTPLHVIAKVLNEHVTVRYE